MKKILISLLFFTTQTTLWAQLQYEENASLMRVNSNEEITGTNYTADSIENRIARPYINNINNKETLVRQMKSGIFIVGTGDSLYALNAFAGGKTGGTWYANMVNKYQQQMGNGIHVYNMIIPLASEFYTPQKAEEWTNSQRDVINNIYTHLNNEVTAVDVYTPLAEHANEKIYNRTDHHWAALGAYYAAQRFAKLAKVPFRTLDNYDKKVVKGYVGSMYHFTKDISVKNARDSFEYYIPRNVEFNTTYTYFKRGKNKQIIGEKDPQEGDFFIAYPDSSFGAYCTFMGGDEKMVKVKTSTTNGRRLMLIKDSFGNAIPSFLFHSFEEIYVVDFRYFTRNIVKYAHENNITDLLIINNVSHAYAPSTSTKLEKLLNN